jgi:hypothetical protein
LLAFRTGCDPSQFPGLRTTAGYRVVGLVRDGTWFRAGQSSLLPAGNRLENTALCVQVATHLLHEVTSPLDRLAEAYFGRSRRYAFSHPDRQSGIGIRATPAHRCQTT